MSIAAFVEWTPLIELLAIIAAVLCGVFGALWFVVVGAKRCASRAVTRVAVVEEKTNGVEKALVALTRVVGESLSRLHARLDEHFKNGG
jgi:hypothetical protein